MNDVIDIKIQIYILLNFMMLVEVFNIKIVVHQCSMMNLMVKRNIEKKKESNYSL